MTTFDDCTLAEVEMVTETCLKGKNMGDENVDPMLLAGGIMWIMQRRIEPNLEWDAFKASVRMSDIKAFSIQMEADGLDPTPSHNVPVT